MSTRVTWVGYGRPAAEVLAGALARAKGDDALAPACVVVPSNHVGVAARRLLASGRVGAVGGPGRGLVAVTFLTVYRLAELLGATELAGRGRRPVSTPILAAAVRAALAEDAGVFGPVADHPATELALVAAYRELRDLSDGALDALAASSPRAADVVRLQRRARRELARRFSDEEDLMHCAAALVEADPSMASALGAIVVYLPQRLSRHGAHLLRTLGHHHELDVVAGTTGVNAADAGVRRSIDRLTGPAVEGRHLVVTAPRADGATRVVTTSDADDEVRVAVRAVVDAARAGTPLDRMAVLYGTDKPYARAVHEQLGAAGIAHNGSSVVPLTARVAGRTLLGLMALADTGFRRDDVFAWLAGAPVRHRGRWVPVSGWERLSRDAGVVGGRQDWDERLATFAAECERDAQAAAADPEAPPWLAERRQGEADRARDLREFALDLFDQLRRADAPRRWSEHATWARARLHDLLGSAAARAGWPPPEEKAAERTDRALDRLARLDEVEGPVPLAVFRRTLELELDADLGRVGRIGEGVLVGSVRMGVGLDLDLAVVLGLAEGSFPAAQHDDSLLPDHERAATVGELDRRDEDTERQHHDLLAGLAGADRRVLCVPRGDLRRSIERPPSRWVLEEVSPGSLDSGHVDIEEVASFDAGLRRFADPATEQEHRLRAMLAGGAMSMARVGGQGAADEILGRGLELVAARCGPAFTRFDGNLAGVSVPSPVDTVVSATRLERWAGCPFAYFGAELLGVEPVENPEDRLRISPLDLGSLVHEVLELFVADVLARPLDRQPAPHGAWTEDDHRSLRTIADGVCERYEGRGLVGRPLFWHRDRQRLQADLDRFLAEDSAHRAARGTRPVAAELSFGLRDSTIGTVSLPISGGRSVRFRGKADRLDEADDGSLEVLDYKTGRSRAYRGLSEDEPDGRGTHLQLPVYALAARAARGRPEARVRAEYWFVSARGDFERVGYPVTDDVLQHVGDTVGLVVDGIEAGAFPPFPTAMSSTPFVVCPYCDPDGLGVTELRRLMTRKHDDPALAMLKALAADPDETDTDNAAADDAAADDAAADSTGGSR